MKALLVKCGVILIGLLMFGYTEVWGAEWEKVYEDDMGEYFYDAQNVAHPSEYIVIVYEKSLLTQKGVWDWVQRLGNSFRDLSYTMRLSELNCADRRWRWLVMSFYSNEDKMLKSVTADTISGGNIISPESLSGRLFEAVCK